MLTRYVIRRESTTILPGHFTMNRLFISTCGLIFGHVIVAYLSWYAVNKNAPPGYVLPDNGAGILLWATRPRASFATFLVNGLFVFSDLRCAQEQREGYFAECDRVIERIEREYRGYIVHYNYWEQEEMRKKAIASLPKPPASPNNVFLKTCVTSFLAEAHICLIGVSIWYNFFGYTEPFDDISSEHQECRLHLVGAAKIVNGEYKLSFPRCSAATNRTILLARAGLSYSAVLFVAFVLLPVWFLSSRRCCASTSLGGLFKWMIVCWVPATGIFAFSFMLWKAFLDGTSDEDYCIVGTKKLDLIYGLWAVILAIWRQAV